MRDQDFRNRASRPADPGRHGLDRAERTDLGPCSIAEESSTKCSNAKHHQREGRDRRAGPGAKTPVTIATNMAGRAVPTLSSAGNPEAMAWAQSCRRSTKPRLDIPNEEWDELVGQIESARGDEGRGSRTWPRWGGLHIIGTERHEARRIDLQLRGRCGRQGDPGSSRFFLSLEDDLMRIFAGEWVKNILTRLGMKEGEAIEKPHGLSRRIEGAPKKKVEERNFEIRKSLPRIRRGDGRAAQSGCTATEPGRSSTAPTASTLILEDDRTSRSSTIWANSSAATTDGTEYVRPMGQAASCPVELERARLPTHWTSSRAEVLCQGSRPNGWPRARCSNCHRRKHARGRPTLDEWNWEALAQGSQHPVAAERSRPRPEADRSARAWASSSSTRPGSRSARRTSPRESSSWTRTTGSVRPARGWIISSTSRSIGTT